MLSAFLALVALLLLTAAFLRGDFALTLVYLLVGAMAAGAWWRNRALKGVQARRSFGSHAFLGEQVKIQLRIRNRGWLPIPWLELHEALPVALAGPHSFQSVIHLSPRGRADFEYSVEARKRGYYPIGPLSLSTGDILGLSPTRHAEGQPEYLVVYPKIISFSKAEIPSRAPQGTLRHTVPLFEDPSRVFGKRGYASGDSLRRIDWKSSAAAGRLQVKLFEPSLALETCVVLDLNTEGYYYRSRIDAMELAIVIAASISNWIIQKKQMVGLVVNGYDPFITGGKPRIIPPRKGKQHLVRLLETLARVEAAGDSALVPMIREQRYRLAWGTTLIVITGMVSDELLHELYQARRSGQDALLILAGRDIPGKAIESRARAFGIPVFRIAAQDEIQAWMQRWSGP